MYVRACIHIYYTHTQLSEHIKPGTECGKVAMSPMSYHSHIQDLIVDRLLPLHRGCCSKSVWITFPSTSIVCYLRQEPSSSPLVHSIWPSAVIVGVLLLCFWWAYKRSPYRSIGSMPDTTVGPGDCISDVPDLSSMQAVGLCSPT